MGLDCIYFYNSSSHVAGSHLRMVERFSNILNTDKSILIIIISDFVRHFFASCCRYERIAVRDYREVSRKKGLHSIIFVQGNCIKDYCTVLEIF